MPNAPRRDGASQGRGDMVLDQQVAEAARAILPGERDH
jgi:hypothetical protein